MTTPRRLIAGNWKMYGLEASLGEARAIAEAVDEHAPGARVAICPPATLLSRLAHTLAGSGVEVGGQDCHAAAQGAFTGCVSAEMLADAGATLVILGHSERRAGCGETSADVAAKVEAALRAGLEPIVCVGETSAEREAGRTLEVVLEQLRGSLPDALAGAPFALAYEPIWAIGTGVTPTSAEIEDVHGAIRRALSERWPGAGAPILYGGSVKPDNASEILGLAEVGGALVGGASLTATQFLPIVRAA
ncbi:MAG TPA: triose-phosphate isomerase [Caulobacteraceae bacterium]|nr:triose-phosphate isomerase [Caulobacteraceae bacterium]